MDSQNIKGLYFRGSVDCGIFIPCVASNHEIHENLNPSKLTTHMVEYPQITL